MHRVVGMALVAVVAGVPALAMTCAALCAPDTAHGQPTAAAEATAPSCGHPGSEPDADDRVAHDGQPASAPARVMTASAHGCCSDDTVLSASWVAGRVEAHAWTAAGAAGIVTAFRALAPECYEPIHSPPVSPQSPARAPLVLRV